MNAEAHEDLQWWNNFLPSWNGIIWQELFAIVATETIRGLITREKSNHFEIAMMKMNKKSFSNSISVSTLTRKGGYKHIANDVSYACNENGCHICYARGEN